MNHIICPQCEGALSLGTFNVHENGIMFTTECEQCEITVYLARTFNQLRGWEDDDPQYDQKLLEGMHIVMPMEEAA